MDGTIVLIVAASANSVALGVVVFAVRKIVNTAINGIGKRLDTEREDRIKIDNELWSAVNSHGHKGLNGDDAKVTR
jgi:hypothetical protein